MQSRLERILQVAQVLVLDQRLNRRLLPQVVYLVLSLHVLDVVGFVLLHRSFPAFGR